MEEKILFCRLRCFRFYRQYSGLLRRKGISYSRMESSEGISWDHLIYVVVSLYSFFFIFSLNDLSKDKNRIMKLPIINKTYMTF